MLSVNVAVIAVELELSAGMLVGSAPSSMEAVWPNPPAGLSAHEIKRAETQRIRMVRML